MKHKKEHNKSSLNCGHCGKEFKYESERKRHEQSHSPQFECKVCFKKFSFISAVRRHEKQHERKGNVVCTECNRKFRDESLLKRHIKYAHKGSFTCSKCDATFSSDLALRSHSKTHKPIAERKYHCSFHGCTKSFNYTHHLKHHELTHTNMKQHYCNVCGKGFIQSHHLKSHKKTHEPENWLICDIAGCKKTFPTEYARKKHIAVHDKKIKPETDTPVFDANSTCDITNVIEPDTVKCSSCKQILLREHYDNHLTNCVVNNAIHSDGPKEKQTILTKLEPVKLDCNKDDISGCKSFVGGCIIGANANIIDKCLCAQISAVIPTEDYLALANTDNSSNFRPFTDSESGKSNNNDKIDDVCEGCDCQGFKFENVAKTEPSCAKETVPLIEYRKDGTIKIKDTFDLDIEPINNKIDMVQYSCKDVLGNCIVSGNGTIGEGCLCARMAVDDQPMSAQEIEELTPCPMTE